MAIAHMTQSVPCLVPRAEVVVKSATRNYLGFWIGLIFEFISYCVFRNLLLLPNSLQHHIQTPQFKKPCSSTLSPICVKLKTKTNQQAERGHAGHSSPVLSPAGGVLEQRHPTLVETLGSLFSWG